MRASRAIASVKSLPVTIKPDKLDRRVQAKVLDATWTYDYNRYDSPKLSRWLSRDPIEEDGNKYVYSVTSNDPCNKNDILWEYEWGGFASEIHQLYYKRDTVAGPCHMTK